MVLALSTALFGGCLKSPAPLADGGGRALTVVSLVDPVSIAPTDDAPAAFDAAILAVLQSRRLAPELHESDEMLAELAGKRDTRQRLAVLGQPGSPLLLIEAQPLFYSELSGQYRWTVAMHATLLNADGSTLDSSFDVPVFLHHHHEREADAVQAAAPVAARRVGELVDTWLGGG
jgi:hypothetical protein